MSSNNESSRAKRQIPAALREAITARKSSHMFQNLDSEQALSTSQFENNIQGLVDEEDMEKIKSIELDMQQQEEEIDQLADYDDFEEDYLDGFKSKSFRALTQQKFNHIKRYIAGGSRTLLLLLFLIDVSWVLVYFVERGTDQCIDEKWYETPRTSDSGSYIYQVIISYFIVVWSVFKLVFFGRQYFLGFPIFFLNIFLSIPFIVSVGVPFCVSLYVPSFLRVWSSYKVIGQMFALIDKDQGFFASLASKYENVIRIFYIMIAFLVTGMCGFRWTANCFEPKPIFPYDFIDSIYFMIVTISTVGYGEINPQNSISRLFVMSYILIALAHLPDLLTRYIEIMRESKKNNKEYDVLGLQRIDGGQHMVVVGNLEFDVMAPFISFARYYVERTTSFQIDIPRIVMLSTKDLDNRLKGLVRAPGIERHFFYIRGDSLRRRDLNRAKTATAQVCFIVKDNSAKSTQLLDYDKVNILRLWSVILCAPKCKIYIYLNKVENRRHIEFLNIPDGTEVHPLCEDEMKLSLLALDCLFPGTSSLLFSLVVQPSRIELENYHSMCFLNWHNEYLQSLRQTLFTIPVRRFQLIHDTPLRRLSLSLYKYCGSTVLGVKSTGKQMVIGPVDHIISDTDTLYIISWSSGILTKVLPFLRFYGTNRATNNSNRSSNVSQIRESVYKNPVPGSASGSAYPLNPNGPTSPSASPYKSPKATPPSQSPQLFVPEEYYCAEPSDILEKNIIDYPPHPYNGAIVYRCVLSRTVRLLQDCIIHDTRDIKNGHIVIWAHNYRLFHFLARLRAATLASSMIKDIVIMGQSEPEEDVWKQINRFPNVWFLKGNVNKSQDLKKAGIDKASSFVILRASGIKKTEDPSEDSEALIGNRLVKDLNTRPSEAPKLHIITDLACHRSIKFACQDYYKYNRLSVGSTWDYMFEEAFITGNVWTNKPLSNVFVTMYVKPIVYDIFGYLTGTKIGAEGLTLIKIPVPPLLTDKPAHDTYEYFLTNFGALMIGIQRAVNPVLENTHVYNVINPAPELLLYSEDFVYLLQKVQ